jgi:hypothetical protein
VPLRVFNPAIVIFGVRVVARHRANLLSATYSREYWSELPGVACVSRQAGPLDCACFVRVKSAHLIFRQPSNRPERLQACFG